MFLSEKIEKLLLTNSCVTIPAFGGFIKQPKSACITDNVIYPSEIEVGFNQMLLHDDGLLCQVIMEDERVNFDSSKRILSRHVEEFKQLLTQNGAVKFGRLGEFVFKDNLLLFNPFGADFLPENFALDSLQVEPIAQKHNIGKSIEITSNSITINLPKSRNRFTKYAAILAIACTLALLVPKDSSTEVQMASFGMNLNSENSEVTNNNFDFFNKNIINPFSVDNFIQSNNNQHDKIEIIEKEEPQKKLNYHLIVASFTTKNDAENFCSQTPNFSENRLYILRYDCKNGIKYRISMQSYETCVAAINEMDSLKKIRSELKNAWVLCDNREIKY
ncbi:MAG: hypothetical protein LBT04_08255 [Prevotellaceae bacterium]|jgi:hypothetical protein|nr:hypothetical protein [Prevotellaceae bacterium]